VLDGGGGADVLNGGAGMDTLSYANSPSGVTVSLANPSMGTGEAAGDTYLSVENVIGSDFDDTLSGDDLDNVLDGGAGIDTLSYADSTSGVYVNLETSTTSGGDGDDVLSSFEEVIGSDYNDTLIGDDSDNMLDGGPGNDVLLGGVGDDQLLGGQGRDLLIGGTGEDVLDGGDGENLLIAGTTAFDGNRAALAAIMAEWTSERSYSDRVANVRGTGSGPRNNENFFLKVSGPDATVFDDDAVDALKTSGDDWYFINLAGGLSQDVIDGFLDDGDLIDELTTSAE
jgi:Ca2+-binding RTX toxin-like protein